MRFTLFDSIGQGLAETQLVAMAKAKPVDTTFAIEDYLNLNAHRSVIIDAYGRHGTPLVLVGGSTPYAFRYPHETEWLIPVIAFKKHCKRELYADPVEVMRGARVEKRPHPDMVGVTAEFVVWVEARPMKKGKRYSYKPPEK
jgi:hypothetical protein